MTTIVIVCSRAWLAHKAGLHSETRSAVENDVTSASWLSKTVKRLSIVSVYLRLAQCSVNMATCIFARTLGCRGLLDAVFVLLFISRLSSSELDEGKL